MKTFIIILLSAFVCALSPWSGHAGIESTKHNFAATGTSACLYCHNTHKAKPGPALLNPNFGSLPVVTQVYSTATKTNHTSTYAGVNSTDVPMCLACHDKGTVQNNAALLSVYNKLEQRIIDTGRSAYIGRDVGVAPDNSIDLSYDHPVGIVYDHPTQSPTNFKTPAKAKVNFGSTGNQLWCSSCHNAHSETSFFLVTSNAGSALCLDCHLK